MAEGVYRAVDEPLDLCFPGDIGLDRNGLAALGLNGINHPVRPGFAAAIVDDDRRAGLGKAGGNTHTQAAAAAGDDNNLAGKVKELLGDRDVHMLLSFMSFSSLIILTGHVNGFIYF